MINVRQATLEDRPAIIEFIKLAYPDRWKYKYPERWLWEFVDNPFLDGKGLPVFIAEDEQGKVIGQTCTMMEPLKLGAQLVRVGWSVDSFVLPEYRGQGVGSLLQKANNDSNEIFMSLDMSPTNRRIKSRLGSIPLAPVPIYYRLVRYQSESIVAAVNKRFPVKWMEQIVRRSGAAQVGAALKNVLLSMRDRRIFGKVPSELTIEPISRFGEEFDWLWEAVSPHFYASVQRCAAYLNWKFIQQPFQEYQRYMVRRQGKLCGYAVLRMGRPPEPNLGILADLFASPDDNQAITTLLTHAVRVFRRAGVKDVLTASSVPAYQVILEKLGFRPIGEAVPMFHCRIPGFRYDDVLGPGRWLLGKADHDWDQFPLAR